MPAAPTEFDLNAIRNDPVRLATIRRRLSDLSWWMRLLYQYIAMRANAEDGDGLGRFWQGRYEAVRILDEESLLACAAYIDLNPIRADMAETLEQSDYTSVQRRVQSIKATALDAGSSGELRPLGTPHIFVGVVASRIGNFYSGGRKPIPHIKCRVPVFLSIKRRVLSS